MTAASTSLFDPARGVDEPVADNSAQMQTAAPAPGAPMKILRLDGILSIGDRHRVLLMDPKGEPYRFRWQGTIDQPLSFEGRGADKLAGYGLVALEGRSVWLQLPPGTGCEPKPEIGISVCKDGRVRLALMRRETTPEKIAVADKQAGPKMKPKGLPRGINPFTGQPLKAAPSTGKVVQGKKRISLKKSQAWLRAEALKKEYAENNRRALQQRKEQAAADLPPGFKASNPLFGQSSVVEDGKAEKIVKPKPSSAAEEVARLKELYRQRNQEILKQGGSRTLGFGLVPKAE